MIMLPVMFKNSWFPTVFDDFFNSDAMATATTTAPAVNVREDLNEYTMEMAVPGIKKEYCRVQLTDDGNLHVAIENKMEHYLRREFSYTNYQQTYTLPDDVAKDRISAKVDNGILSVVMPKLKKEESKVARAIEIA